MPESKFRAAWNFFRLNAGYATPPGRAACALELARAEAYARNAGWTVAWYPDEACSWTGEPTEDCGPCEVATLYGDAPNDGQPRSVLASLGCVHAHGDAIYRRVVEAELAAEARAEYPEA